MKSLDLKTRLEGPLEAAVQPLESTVVTPHADVVVAGSLAVDLTCDYSPDPHASNGYTPQLATSNPAVITQSLGGVAHNVARTLHYLGTSAQLYSVVADDAAGIAALNMLAQTGMHSQGIQQIKNGARTSQYVAFNDVRKELVLGMADMKIMETAPIDFDEIWKPKLDLARPKWVALDSNWDAAILRKWLQAAKAVGAKLAFEPVSSAKCKRLFQPFADDTEAFPAVPDNMVSLATPNVIELASMYDAARDAGLFDRKDWWRVVNAIGMSSTGSRDRLVSITNKSLVDHGVPQQSLQLLPFIPTILTKLGDQGVLLTQLLAVRDPRLRSQESAAHILGHRIDEGTGIGGVYMRLFPPAELVAKESIVSVNGIGDTFLGVILAGLAKETKKDWPALVDLAQRSSVMTLKSRESVCPNIGSLRSLL